MDDKSTPQDAPQWWTGLDSVPKIVAPSTTGLSGVAEYVAELDMTKVDAIAHHLYGTDTTNLDYDALAALRDLGQQHERPLFQTEMLTDPLTMAVLMHASFTGEDAVVYVERGFVASAGDIQPEGLINLTDDDFAMGDGYHVMRHYSGHIGPGWERVDADSDTDEVLASAWISPEEDALVVVLTNPDSVERIVQIDTDADAPAATAVTRTVLGDGLERSAELGETRPRRHRHATGPIPGHRHAPEVGARGRNRRLHGRDDGGSGRGVLLFHEWEPTRIDVGLRSWTPGCRPEDRGHRAHDGP